MTINNNHRNTLMKCKTRFVSEIIQRLYEHISEHKSVRDWEWLWWCWLTSTPGWRWWGWARCRATSATGPGTPCTATLWPGTQPWTRRWVLSSLELYWEVTSDESDESDGDHLEFFSVRVSGPLIRRVRVIMRLLERRVTKSRDSVTHVWRDTDNHSITLIIIKIITPS